ncbi:uncharacterized protein PpBr36_09405 [Pyricularia pennisetigena]|uniref:uncharacterized protein n=1 Tax=Pyricularia pennisetigena TaxID=1578925 RepID=UPI001153FFED|nr:uncharacterized protein PpBr36_09405 [Pyricularia pennisetigena]TLS22062.1 hypothetical protein PpBr36_09405 [Pyricularia pennisetigena]
MSSRGAASAAGQPSILSFFRPNNKDPAPMVVQPPKQHQQPPLPPPPPPAPLQSPSPGAVAAAAAASSRVGPTPPATTPHPSASIVPITADHIAPLRRINALLLCVNYPDSFYQRILDPAASGLFSRAILWSETDDKDTSLSAEPPKVIGSIVARVETSPFSKQRSALYIQSLTLLSPFRSLGLARAALDAVLDHARRLRSAVDISDVYAHVWTENEDGLRWYAARGFERVGSRPEQGYYHKLRPDTAWIVRRSLDGAASASDISAAMARTTAAAPPSPAVVPPSVTAAVVNLPLKTPPAPAPTSSASAKAAALCFQDKRPETDWNDLPPDVAAGLLTPGSGQGSEASSRSSSTARGPKKKRDRAYPAAAFGS